MATRAVLVISFEESDPGRVAEMMDVVRDGLSDVKDVVVYAAIRERAAEVIKVFEDD